MKIKFLTIFLLLFFVNEINGQDSLDMYIEKEFVIILSSPKYENALKTANSASKNLNLKLDLRELKKNSKTGLTWNEKDCENEWGEYPCYVARGRFDDGDYVSIEYSDAFSGFRKGYYIVIIASGSNGDAMVKKSYNDAKKIYKDVYRKVAKVYMGCMH